LTVALLSRSNATRLEIDSCVIVNSQRMGRYDISRDFSTLFDAMRDLALPFRLRTSLSVAIPDELAGRAEIIKLNLSYPVLRDLYTSARIVFLPLHDMVCIPVGSRRWSRRLVWESLLFVADRRASRTYCAMGNL
jgi:hypothetical protein